MSDTTGFNSVLQLVGEAWQMRKTARAQRLDARLSARPFYAAQPGGAGQGYPQIQRQLTAAMAAPKFKPER